MQKFYLTFMMCRWLVVAVVAAVWLDTQVWLAVWSKKMVEILVETRERWFWFFDEGLNGVLGDLKVVFSWVFSGSNVFSLRSDGHGKKNCIYIYIVTVI